VFTTQRQLTMKNMPDSAKDNPMFRAQKMMLYGYPVFFAISGVNFPIGVLIYWTTTNLWSMGQQFFVIRNNPAPGSEAEKVYLKREDEKLKRKAERTGRPYEELKAEFDAKKAEREAEEKAKRMKKGKSGPGLMGKITHAAGQAAQNQLAEQQQLQAQAQAHQQRVQPKRQSRSQRRGGAGGGAAGGTSEKTPPPQLQVKHGSGSGHGENAGSSGKPNGGNSGSAGGKPGASGAGGKSGKSGKK
jgi:YidC/Oxa1 family membrane protein insertase